MRPNSFEALAILGPLIVPAVVAADSSRPRGVGPEFAKYYKAGESFSCISNPGITLSFSQVNDDYCDCPDGSDEPGTAACSYLSLAAYPPAPVDQAGYSVDLALPGFYCKNKGHRPSYLPFTNVNDGICDYEICCDGSDEWEGVGGTKCEDKCKEIGKEWRTHNDARQKSLGNANRKRKELAAEAAKLRKEVEDRLQTIRSQIEAGEIKVTNMKQELANIERSERGKVIKGPSSGGKLGVLSGLAKRRIQELRDTMETIRWQRNEAKIRVEQLEEILTTFKKEYNPNFNDEGVKRAVQRWEDYAAGLGETPDDDATERDIDEVLKTDEENGLDWAEFETVSEESDVDVLFKFEEYLPKPLRDWVHDKLHDTRTLLVDYGILAAPPQEGAEPKAVTDARLRLTSAESEVSGYRTELTQHEKDLTTEYGPSEVFRSMKGKCIQRDAGEYTYELCWMERTTQKAKKGGSSTGMGNFAGFDKIEVDDELPADGKGLGSGLRYVMKYENGQHCWNGPNRSTKVILACSEIDEIWKVAEEEKCVYRMEVGTPAVCEPSVAGQQVPQKDEL